MNPDLVKKFGFRVRKTKVDTQKIDGSKLDTFDIVIAFFSMKDKEKRSHFFEEIFLLANISMDIALDMTFFTLILR